MSGLSFCCCSCGVGSRVGSGSALDSGQVPSGGAAGGEAVRVRAVVVAAAAAATAATAVAAVPPLPQLLLRVCARARSSGVGGGIGVRHALIAFSVAVTGVVAVHCRARGGSSRGSRGATAAASAAATSVP
jgi:hypothetical protein